MGELVLGPIIIREDEAQGTLLGYSHQGAALPFVADQEVMCYQPPSQPLSVSLVPVGEFDNKRAGFVSTTGHPYLSLIL